MTNNMKIYPDGRLATKEEIELSNNGDSLFDLMAGLNRPDAPKIESTIEMARSNGYKRAILDVLEVVPEHLTLLRQRILNLTKS